MRLQTIIILAVATCASASLLTLHAPRRGSLVWNFTSSIPLGLYSVEDRDWVRGERVAAMPSEPLAEILRKANVLKAGRVLLKRVAGVEGDRVCRDGVNVSINGVVVATARSETWLPQWSGCQVLHHGEVFLMGETENSFDGRYFGITSDADIIGPASAILTF